MQIDWNLSHLSKHIHTHIHMQTDTMANLALNKSSHDAMKSGLWTQNQVYRLLVWTHVLHDSMNCCDTSVCRLGTDLYWRLYWLCHGHVYVWIDFDDACVGGLFVYWNGVFWSVHHGSGEKKSAGLWFCTIWKSIEPASVCHHALGFVDAGEQWVELVNGNLNLTPLGMNSAI